MLAIVREYLVKVLVAASAATAFSVQAQEFLPPIIDRSTNMSAPAPAPTMQPRPVVKRVLSVEQRLQKMERLLDGQALVDMSMQLESIQTDSQAMRGEVESLSHAIEAIKLRQRDLYLDVDRRLREMEVATSQPQAAPVAGVGSMAPAVAVVPNVAPTSMPVAQAAPQASVADPAREREAYQQAFNVLKEGQYDKAIIEFQGFLASYPAGEFTDNAQYWLGEANYVTRHFEVAVTEFEKVLQQHPDSSKVSDAMLKLGYTYYELGQWKMARETLDRVVSNHPGTTVARLAGNRLQKMRLENR